MKKKLYIVVIFLLFLSGCAVKSDQRNEEDFTEAKPETITEIHQKVEHAFFEDISYFYKASDIIIVGTVLAKETERINKTELGLINAEDDYYDNITRYQIQVDTVLKGATDNTIIEDQTGGLADGINQIIDGAVYMEEGKQYLLCLRNPAIARGKGYCENVLVSLREGFYELKEDKFYPVDGNCLFTEAFSLDDFQELIKSID